MPNLQANTFMFLMLLATGSCFVSALIDGPLKAAFSLLGGQRRAAPVVSPKTAPQIPAQVAPVVIGSRMPEALSSQVVPNVRPIYEYAKTSNEYGWNALRPTVTPCEDCNWTVQQSDEECKGDCNGHQTVKTYPGEQIISVQPLQNDGWNNEDKYVESPEIDGTWDKRQIVSVGTLKNGGWNNGHMSVGSSQIGNSWVVHRPNVKSIGEQEDWMDISDNIENHNMYGTQVNPIVRRLPVPVRSNTGDTSDVLVITQTEKPISSQGVHVYHRSRGSMAAHHGLDNRVRNIKRVTTKLKDDPCIYC